MCPDGPLPSSSTGSPPDAHSASQRGASLGTTRPVGWSDQPSITRESTSLKEYASTCAMAPPSDPLAHRSAVEVKRRGARPAIEGAPWAHEIATDDVGQAIRLTRHLRAVDVTNLKAHRDIDDLAAGMRLCSRV